MAKKTSTKKKPTDEWHGYKARQKIDVKYVKDGKKYWVTGYQVFDPDKEISMTKGRSAIALKKGTQKRLSREVPVVTSDAEYDGRVVTFPIERVRPAQADNTVTFADIFGGSISEAIILKGVAIESEKDDLSLGISFEAEVDYDD